MRSHNPPLPQPHPPNLPQPSLCGRERCVYCMLSKSGLRSHFVNLYCGRARATERGRCDLLPLYFVFHWNRERERESSFNLAVWVSGALLGWLAARWPVWKLAPSVKLKGRWHSNDVSSRSPPFFKALTCFRVYASTLLPARQIALFVLFFFSYQFFPQYAESWRAH